MKEGVKEFAKRDFKGPVLGNLGMITESIGGSFYIIGFLISLAAGASIVSGTILTLIYKAIGGLTDKIQEF